MKQSEIINSLKREIVVVEATLESMKKKLAMLEAPVVKVKEVSEKTEIITPLAIEGPGSDFDKDATVVEVPVETYDKVAVETMSLDEEIILGCKLLVTFDVKYTGKASYITLHLKTFKNGKQVDYLDRYHVACDVYDEEGNLLGSKYVHKDYLVGFPELLKKGLYTWDKNFKPKSLSFMV